jgi:hypothetical protein
MKLRTLAVFAILLAGAGIISAQDQALRAHIPFSFVVNGATLPAGEYTVRQPYSPHAMTIRDTGNGVQEFTLVVPTTGQLTQPGTPRLVFHRYGDQYFLSQVWSSSGQGNDIPLTRRERDLMASRITPDEPVTVALR